VVPLGVVTRGETKRAASRNNAFALPPTAAACDLGPENWTGLNESASLAYLIKESRCALAREAIWPPGDRNAAECYEAPTLFAWAEWFSGPMRIRRR
jgi:hypothetical protein